MYEIMNLEISTAAQLCAVHLPWAHDVMTSARPHTSWPISCGTGEEHRTQDISGENWPWISGIGSLLRDGFSYFLGTCPLNKTGVGLDRFGLWRWLLNGKWVDNQPLCRHEIWCLLIETSSKVPMPNVDEAMEQILGPDWMRSNSAFGESEWWRCTDISCWTPKYCALTFVWLFMRWLVDVGHQILPPFQLFNLLLFDDKRPADQSIMTSTKWRVAT